MSTFDVRCRHLDEVLPHPNADRLELAVVGGYRCVVGKGQFQAGELVAYLPEAAVLPAPLIEELGLTGKLAGPEKNRIHPVSLRGALSQGVVMKARAGWSVGQSVMEELGVAKFVPEIPKELLGSAYALEEHERLDFDIENIKAYPHLFELGEEIVLTEKVHGVFMAVGGLPEALARECGHRANRSYVSSKGLLASRMAFQLDNPNPYVRAADRLGLHAVAQDLATRWNTPVLVMGELFGTGIQDLGYGQPGGEPAFRVFAIVRRTPEGQPAYLDDEELSNVVSHFGLTRVPVLFRGGYSPEVVAEYTSGRETVSGEDAHLREGVVITPAKERRTAEIGRLALKSVSEAYLLRKGGTEYT